MNYTTEIRIPSKGELFEYLEKFSPFYNAVWRYALRERLNPKYNHNFEKESYFVSHLQQKFNIHSRTANSIVRDVNGRYKTLRGLYVYLLEEKKEKLKRLKEEIKDMEALVSILKDGARKGLLSREEVGVLKEKEKELFFKRNRKDKLNSQVIKLKKALKNNDLTMLPGTKKFFNAQYHLEENGFSSHEEWLEAFRAKRDANILYIGRASETCGNQMIQLTEQENGRFTLKLRKEYKYSRKKRSKDNYIIEKNLKLSYLIDIVSELLNDNKTKGGIRHALSMRFHRRPKGWYLQISFEFPEAEKITDVKNGTIGIDLNSGFLEAVETDRYGNFIQRFHIPLHFHGKGKKGLTEIREVSKALSLWAFRVKKPIVIENLDFRKKKRIKSRNKKKNRILHTLDYSRFRETLKRACLKTGIELIEVNPAYTSMIGRKKYMKKMSLTVHTSAAFVIARRGQGRKENCYNY